MDYYSSQINKLIEQLSKLPGIGGKICPAAGISYYQSAEGAGGRAAGAMREARNNIRYCKECFTLTDQELCPICSSPKRNHKVIMVVENTRDLAAYEKTGKYDGVYHVLHGAISPMLGIGPGDIKLKELMLRLQSDVEEVNYRHQFQSGGRDYSDVHKQAGQAHRHQGDPDCQRRAGGRRSGVH